MLRTSSHRVAFLAIALVLPNFSSNAFAQATGNVRGRVIEAGTRPVVEAQVSVNGTRIGALTGANGEFTLSGVPTGPRTITVRRIGYQPVTRDVVVAAGDNQLGDIAISVSAVNLS
jgi:hypothetical protein